MSSFYTIPKLWPGETIVIIAGGESLTQADINFCRGRARVIAINDAYRLAPWADMFYACDGPWWDVHAAHVLPLAGLKLTHSAAAATAYGLHRIQGRAERGLSANPAYIHLGNNSGYQALNIAVLTGGALILLLGYDMQRQQKTHWFGEHPAQCRMPVNFAKWIRNFETTPADLERLGVTVFNCSRASALTCFPRMMIDEALSHADGLRLRSCG